MNKGCRQKNLKNLALVWSSEKIPDPQPPPPNFKLISGAFLYKRSDCPKTSDFFTLISLQKKLIFWGSYTILLTPPPKLHTKCEVFKVMFLLAPFREAVKKKNTIFYDIKSKGG